MIRFLAAALALGMLAGCADKLLSDDRIRDNTAMALGQPASAVTISGRRYDGAMNTYYTSRALRRAPIAALLAGEALVMAIGITEAPVCNRRSVRPRPDPRPPGRSVSISVGGHPMADHPRPTSCAACVFFAVLPPSSAPGRKRLGDDARHLPATCAGAKHQRI